MILKAKQKLGVTFNSDKLGGIDFTKFSKLSMCSAGAGRCWLVQWPGLPPRHCSFEIFVKAMPPSLSELKVLPSFCFAFKIPDDVTASSTHVSNRLPQTSP